MVESFEDTDKMQDMFDKMQNTTIKSRCKISIYDLASRYEKIEEFDREVITRSFSGDWEIRIGKEKFC